VLDDIDNLPKYPELPELELPRLEKYGDADLVHVSGEEQSPDVEVISESESTPKTNTDEYPPIVSTGRGDANHSSPFVTVVQIPLSNPDSPEVNKKKEELNRIAKGIERAEKKLKTFDFKKRQKENSKLEDLKIKYKKLLNDIDELTISIKEKNRATPRILPADALVTQPGQQFSDSDNFDRKRVDDSLRVVREGNEPCNYEKKAYTEQSPFPAGRLPTDRWFDYDLHGYKFRFNPVKFELGISYQTKSDDLSVKIRKSHFPDNADFVLKEDGSLMTSDGVATPFKFSATESLIRISVLENKVTMEFSATDDSR
jgi:hypothetical protein